MKRGAGNLLREMVTGLVSGAVGGFFGAGGGVFAVLMYSKLMKLPTKEAHACAVATMLPVSTVSGIVYILNGQYEPLLSVQVALGAFGGGLLAGMWFKKIKNALLTRIFGGIMIMTGGWMLLCR